MNDYANARKQYVADVRRSFNQNEDGPYEEAGYTAPAGSTAFKIRFFIALCLFGLFVFCDRTGSRIYRYSTGELVQILQKDSFSSVQKQIQETWMSLHASL